MARKPAPSLSRGCRRPPGELRVAYRNNDAKTVDEVAHALKGSSATMGASDMKQIAGRLQSLGRSGLLGGAETLIGELERALDMARGLLEHALVEGAVRAMKVLFVDDDATIRLTVGAQLRRLGHDVVVAADGREGWRAYELATPDVVITDLVMPGESGASLCRRIRSSQRMRYTFYNCSDLHSRESRVQGCHGGGRRRFLPNPARKRTSRCGSALRKRVLRLQSRVKTLEGFLPICSYCRLLRNGNNEWRPIGEYVAARASVTVDSALCPECAAAV